MYGGWYVIRASLKVIHESLLSLQGVKLLSYAIVLRQSSGGSRINDLPGHSYWMASMLVSRITIQTLKLVLTEHKPLLLLCSSMHVVASNPSAVQPLNDHIPVNKDYLILRMTSSLDNEMQS